LTVSISFAISNKSSSLKFCKGSELPEGFFAFATGVGSLWGNSFEGPFVGGNSFFTKGAGSGSFGGSRLGAGVGVGALTEGDFACGCDWGG